MRDIKPISHGERLSKKPHYHVVDLTEMPNGTDSVTICWRVPWRKCWKLLFGQRIWTSHKTESVKPIRIDI